MKIADALALTLPAERVSFLFRRERGQNKARPSTKKHASHSRLMCRYGWLLLALGLLTHGAWAQTINGTRNTAPDSQPQRVILLVIDGMHWSAPARLPLTNFRQLTEIGTYVRQAWLIAPAHPRSGAWADMHTTSLPNPVMLAGTFFIRPDQPMLQHAFAPHFTAHIANDRAYESLNRGHTLNRLSHGASDETVLEQALAVLRENDVRYLRMHWQDTGRNGWRCHREGRDVPWRRNIWGDGSPYVESLLKADELLGRLVSELQKQNHWLDTLLVVTSDHGQTVTGAHPALHEDGWSTPLIFVGPNVARGRVIDHAEHIDIVPTIARLMKFTPPNTDGGSGAVIENVLLNPTDDKTSSGNERPKHDQPPLRDQTSTHGEQQTEPAVREPTKLMTYRINVQQRELAMLMAQITLAGMERPELHTELELALRDLWLIEQIHDWHQAGTPAKVVETNARTMERLRRLYQPIDP